MMRRIPLAALTAGLGVVLCCGGSSAQFAAGASRLSRTASLGRALRSNRVGSISLARTSRVSALCDVGGRMYGARSGAILLLSESGQVTKTLPMGVQQVAGIAAHKSGTIIIGDCGNRAVMLMNLTSGRVSRLFSLAEINAAGFPPGNLLKDSLLTSVASDGTSIFLAFSAGFSSSIFKVDPVGRRLLAHGWAPGDNPNAMAFQNGSLFVLESRGRQIRRFSGQLKQNYSWIEAPVPDGKGLIIRGNEIRLLSTAQSSIVRATSDVAGLASGPSTVRIVTPTLLRAPVGILDIPRRYAVLICGDVADSCYYCDSFWNDTLWMYKTLLAAGYSKSNIYVLYGNGSDFASANPKYQYPETVTDFAATITWVNKVFDGLKNGDAANGISKMKDSDTLFVWTFDHGAGGSPAYLCLMDGWLVDTSFAAKLNAIPYAKRAIFMQQCRSGGFIDNVSNSKTFVSTACRASENAHAADTENESYGGSTYYHGEYNYHVICALSGLNPSGAAVNADSDASGKVSALETHNWNVTHESRSEVPQMDDSGAIGTGFYIK